jgi:hypothetical protein
MSNRLNDNERCETDASRSELPQTNSDRGQSTSTAGTAARET